jgi:hypothetical protein
MNNILYISFSQILNTVSGGATVTSRNLMFVNSLQKKEVICYSIENRRLESNWSKLANDLFNLSIGGISKFSLISIGQLIELNSVKTVFLDSSNMGVISKFIATNYSNVEIIVFSHNVEYKLEFDLFILSFRFRHLFKSILSFYSERLIFKYSSKVICTTNYDLKTYRDKFKRNRKSDCVIPVSVPALTLNSYSLKVVESKFCLFVGSNFSPNLHGILWFINHILPFIEYRLLIVGKGITSLVSKVPTHLISKVEVLDYVPSLDQFYKDCSFVVAPIFYGSGMKVKVAEAIQYGKPIFLTTHAFRGYESLNKDYPFYICNSPVEYITSIKMIDFSNSNLRISENNLFTHNSVFETFKKFID